MKTIRSRIDIITLKAIEKMVQEYSIPYDVAEEKWKQSVTYKILKNTANEFYLKEIEEIFHIFQQEQFMDEFLNIEISTQLALPSNNIDQIRNQIIKEVTKKTAILKNISIEDAYDSFIHSALYSSLIQKDILNYLDEPDIIYQRYQTELNSKQTKTRFLTKKHTKN